MPPPAILDPAKVDLDAVLFDKEEIRAVNPQRHEFELLDAIVFCDADAQIIAGYHDVRPDAWWARAHFPGRPLLPGVLLIEAAGQLASFATNRFMPGDGRIIGFGGVDGVKFRVGVEPPCRLLLVVRARSMKPRRIICEAQAFVNGAMVFEGVITGMPL